jgi:hypothetical protein
MVKSEQDSSDYSRAGPGCCTGLALASPMRAEMFHDIEKRHVP